MAGSVMGEVFISYARKDAAMARRVAEALRRHGHPVWYDADLPAHRAYSETIEQKLDSAPAVVVLWSAEAARSQWVRAEADVARSQGKIVQARTDDAIPPLPFNQIQCAELKGWRGSGDHAGWRKLVASVDQLSSPAAVADTPPVRRSRRRWWIAAAALTALLLAVVGWRMLSAPGEPERPVVAVLPFDNLGGPDDGLVTGLWEDTRRAIGRNPQLLVLGAHTASELDGKDSDAIAGMADYVVDASVRSAGQRVRISVGLVRTDDQSEVWSETFERRLDDVFALQSEIAREIEGRIRGRLAAQGGVLPEQIATSGEVYALYSQAREVLRRRGLDANDAHAMLQRVVTMDPNFAPGWAALSVAEIFRAPIRMIGRDVHGTAESHARRAIALAPNLAAGHSALALALNLRGPVAEQALERAIALNPNDAETLNWYSSVLLRRGEEKRALQHLRKAAQVEPLWWVPQINLLSRLLADDDADGVNEALDRIERTRSPLLLTRARMLIANHHGDLSDAARMGLAFHRTASESDRNMIGSDLAAVLVQLGRLEEAQVVSYLPPFALPAWRNEPRTIDMLQNAGFSDQDFWRLQVLPLVAARAMLNHARGADLVHRYDAMGFGPDRFRDFTSRHGNAFVILAPMVAMALAEQGRQQEAAALLRLGHSESRNEMRDDPSPDDKVLLARILAVLGRKREAVTLLEKAFADGWRPAIALFLPDLLLDPPLATLRSESRFIRVRNAILDHFARESRELGPVTVAG